MSRPVSKKTPKVHLVTK
uniref:Uncharacterized protein n=1 Tax=Anguilla anguilla TaxID=7936 RepID=A0A0E9QQM7_ANGAN